VSRRHCLLLAREGRWVIQHTGGGTGTYLSGERLTEPRPLKSGDEIAVGDTTFVYDERAGEEDGLTLRRAEPASQVEAEALLVPRSPKGLLTRTPVLIGVAMALVALGIRQLMPVLRREDPAQTVRRAARLVCERQGSELWDILTDNRRSAFPVEDIQGRLDALPQPTIHALRSLRVGKAQTTPKGVVVPVSVQVRTQRLEGQVVLFSDGKRWRIHSAPTEWLEMLPP
jgi:hypothetical protein